MKTTFYPIKNSPCQKNSVKKETRTTPKLHQTDMSHCHFLEATPHFFQNQSNFYSFYYMPKQLSFNCFKWSHHEANTTKKLPQNFPNNHITVIMHFELDHFDAPLCLFLAGTLRCGHLGPCLVQRSHHGYHSQLSRIPARRCSNHDHGSCRFENLPVQKENDHANWQLQEERKEVKNTPSIYQFQCLKKKKQCPELMKGLQEWIYHIANTKFWLPRVVVLFISTPAWRSPIEMGEAWKIML